MKQTQVCVVGGGCVGLTLALGLVKANISVVVIDAAAKQVLPGDEYALRVSALSLASQHLFESLQVWPEIIAQRARAYTHMDVRDQDSFGKIAFNSDELDLPHLGHIVENDIIRYALINELEQYSQATLMFDTRYQQIHQSDNDVFITLDSGEPVIAKLLVAADGANSAIRKQFNLPITFKDYDHNAIVATVRTTEPHNNTARQVFLPTGPLAFLPLPDANTHSIVWSTSPAHCQTLLAMDDSDFNKAVMAALDGQCGLCEVQSARTAFPLKMRYAQQWVTGKVVLMGDAAHTIHPLAGLGMNLGLKDAAYLIELLTADNKEFASNRLLRDYERTRKLDAQKHIAMMQGLKELFAGANPLKKLVRGVGLSLVDNLGPIKHLFAKQAIGK
ncbi:FAD-dependent monooxygenase [Pseudoalteromonas sp. SR44-5]|uniref:FAD-dependent monooxygenase n=1 Tax=Pseudoalteromonas TaxID=53246 RepID=UPI0015FFED0E|nr:MULTISPECIES: FAD-dependent monooxygenase [Pseudoalteromonas]MBB1294013.1 FAD-dependent monooxygenase [Pseudoalteromonas sp. SR41-4]MBB1301413.1 FAD-dependent monooxygenase [Pseudoalteromonas sp. SR44-8]MBB1311432.1 FAD-dependent monooxygenase [Pseudoalteromonas sp. SR41-8]MBB1343994.1 FAD-dependent monooxygenase [Pseudoalteromonas sp. SR45-6]MBB1368259.1 FAD-dependent monooxygenase [Pseudoalteromonas sp. SR44-5]